MHEAHALVSHPETEAERQPAHEVLGRPIRVNERPFDRALAELAIVGIDVGAAAVVLAASDRVVVVAVDGRDRPLLDQLTHLVRVRSVADQVTAAVGGFDSELVDAGKRGLQRRKVAVDIGDHGGTPMDGRPHQLTPVARVLTLRKDKDR